MQELICQKCSTDIKVSKITFKCHKCYQADYMKKYQVKKKQELKEYKHTWYLEQKDEQAAKDKARYPEIRSRKIAAAKAWKKRNPEKVNHYTALRRATQLNQTPSWVNKQDLKEIYINCPEGKTIDHIIPLNNKNVSGLHVPWNLQYLDPSDNYHKQSQFDGTYDNNSWKLKNE